MFHWLKGELPIRASGWGRQSLFTKVDPLRDVNDHYAVELEWADGFRAAFVQSWIAPADDGFTGSSLRVMGEEAGFDFATGALTYRDRGGHAASTRGLNRTRETPWRRSSTQFARESPRLRRFHSPTHAQPRRSVSWCVKPSTNVASFPWTRSTPDGIRRRLDSRRGGRRRHELAHHIRLRRLDD